MIECMLSQTDASLTDNFKSDRFVLLVSIVEEHSLFVDLILL